MEWSHTVLGRFDISQQWLGLDLRNLFLDPIRAETTLFHEATHSLISRTTDMGQAMQNISFFIQRFSHLSKDQQDEILITLKESQVFVQEGFATFMEMQRLRQRVSWEAALAAKEQMHPDYLTRFEKMEFMFGKTHKMRERFTKKISLLVMESGFRKNAPSLDLLRSPISLNTYLDQEDNNPGKRLEKVLAALRVNERILIEKPRKLARLCGIKFFEPATKEEVVAFVNYLLGLAGLKQDYATEMVGRVNGGDVLADTMENLLVTNMNLDLSKTGMMLWEAEDINFEASHAQAAFMVQHTSLRDEDVIERHLKRKFEVDIIFFGKNGEKYLGITSTEHAQHLLKDQLKSATILTKWGITSPTDSSFSISDKRKPDIIIYNRPSDMLATFQSNEQQLKNYRFIHLGMSKDHPFQSLLVKINGQNTVHFVNGFGNAGILKVIEFMKKKGKKIDAKDLIPNSRAINDVLATMGMPWDIDWVATIINQKAIIRR